MTIKIKKRYDKTEKVTLDQSGQLSKTKQSFKDQVNINKIVEKYNKTGQFPNLIKQNPKYGDFSNPMDYQESLNKVLLANEQFNALSAKVRDRFDNDPVKLLQFVSDAKNLEEMYDLGLAIRPASEAILEANSGKAASTGKAGNSQAAGTAAKTQE